MLGGKSGRGFGHPTHVFGRVAGNEIPPEVLKFNSKVGEHRAAGGQMGCERCARCCRPPAVTSCQPSRRLRRY